MLHRNRETPRGFRHAPPRAPRRAQAPLPALRHRDHRDRQRRQHPRQHHQRGRYAMSTATITETHGHSVETQERSAGTKERLLMHGDLVDGTLLPKALAWWAKQDDMGGFRAVGAVVFPGWDPGSACIAPHRADRLPRFSINQNNAGGWYYKDHSNGTSGGLMDLVSLSGKTTAQSAHWLMHNAQLQSPNEIRITKPQFQTQQPEEETQTMQAPVSNQNTHHANGNGASVNGHAAPQNGNTASLNGHATRTNMEPGTRNQ